MSKHDENGSNADDIEDNNAYNMEENDPLVDGNPEDAEEIVYDDEKTTSIRNVGEAAFENESHDEGIFGGAMSIASGDTTLLSAFTSDIAETMNILRAACSKPHRDDVARIALTAVKTMCKDRFEAKRRLGSSGASDHLVDILRIYRKNPELLLLACETLREFMLNENDNKIFMGAVGLVAQIIPTFELCDQSSESQAAVMKLAIDCCHNKIKGLLVKYTKPKRPASRGTTPLTSLYPDYLSIDNRAKLGEVGFCSIPIKILDRFRDKSHEQNDPDHLVILCAKAISTLSTNDENSKIFGTLGACELVSYFLASKQTNLERSVPLLWAAIILCSDPGNDNKERFREAGFAKVLVDLLHEVQRYPTLHSKHNLFAKYMEYIAWGLMNFIRELPENMKNLRKITYAQVVIDNCLSIDVIPKAAKIKLNQVYIDVYEKFYFDESVVTPLSNNDDEEDKVYLTQQRVSSLATIKEDGKEI